MSVRRVSGLFFLLLGILFALSLGSFSEGDWPMSSKPGIHNLCGKFGALVSFWGFFLFGVSAWLFPLAFFAVAGLALSRPPENFQEKPGRTAAAAGLLLAFSCGVFFLLWPDDSRAGGRLGMWLGARLGVFGKTGSALILSFLGALALIGILPAAWWPLVWKFLRSLPGRLSALIGDLWGSTTERGAFKKPIPVADGLRTEVVRKEKPPLLAPEVPRPASETPALGAPEALTRPSAALADSAPASPKTIPFPMPARAAADSGPASIQPQKSPVREWKPQQDETPEERQFREGLARYRLPPLELLKWPQDQDGDLDQKSLQNAGQILEDTLKNFGIDAQVVQIVPGPTVTLYEVLPAPGVSVSRIAAREADLKLALAADSVRIEAPIPGKSVVGVEVPTAKPKIVKLRELLAFEKFTEGSFILPFALGKNIHGKPVIIDLQKMPHILIAGATGSGKSICIGSLLLTLLFRLTPANLRLILIDPKRVELSMFSEIPHLLSQPILDAKGAARAFKWLMIEMESRYNILSDSGSKNLESYNAEQVKLGMVPMPYIVLVVDELADLMLVAPRETEGAITRLSQMSRAVGIHLVLATQRPSVDVITGLIKANMPARIAFQVASQFDARTILDAKGAETLLGRGDMLFLSPTAPKPVRLQGAYVDEEEIRRAVDFIRNQMKPAYVDFDEIPEGMMPSLDAATTQAVADGAEDIDPQLYEAAKRFTIDIRKGSVSMLQRKFKVGFNRAAKIIDMLEKDGVVGPNKGPTPRDVLIAAPARQREEEEIRG
ncbi:DNA translocase FtsK [bacterium]|nr:DNA translocase FtsK [bacterium]